MQRKPVWLRTLINMKPEDYLKVLANTACAVGNSSSFVRDSSHFGTPVVLVGGRQEGREVDQNVRFASPVAGEIESAILAQLARGRYPAGSLYGDGHASERIAEAVVRLKPYVQKRLHYVQEKASALVFEGANVDHYATVAVPDAGRGLAGRPIRPARVGAGRES